ncbi:MAG: hypothetical protein WCX65_16630 [bacterium]
MRNSQNAIGAEEQKREWLGRGREGCAHYWIGTGERSGGREKFVCRWCGAAMTEPLELSPARGEAARIPPGHAECETCGGVVHWSRTVRSDRTGGRVCLDCLGELI